MSLHDISYRCGNHIMSILETIIKMNLFYDKLVGLTSQGFSFLWGGGGGRENLQLSHMVRIYN